MPVQTKSGSTVKANYSYLSDGAKASVLNASGTGYDYNGTFTYSHASGGTRTLESVAFGGGRIRKTGSSYAVDYYVTDHLGSVRAIVNASGAIVEQNDFYPFGTRQQNGLSTLSANRWRFSGKEGYGSAFGIALDDFGARRYDRTAWTSIDPLSEKYYSISPYAYCSGNPVKFVDPEGNIVLFADYVSEEFKEKFGQAIEYMNECGTSYNIAALQKSERVYYVTEGEKNQYRGDENTIYWNPNIVSMDSQTKLLRSPVTSLAHEFGHARNHEEAIINGTISTFIDDSSPHSDMQYDTIEDRNVITKTEQYAARRHREISDVQVTRYGHRGTQRQTVVFNNEIIQLSDKSQRWISKYVQKFNSRQP